MQISLLQFLVLLSYVNTVTVLTLSVVRMKPSTKEVLQFISSVSGLSLGRTDGQPFAAVAPFPWIAW